MATANIPLLSPQPTQAATYGSATPDLGNCYLCQEPMLKNQSLFFAPCAHKIHEDCRLPQLTQCGECRTPFNQNQADQAANPAQRTAAAANPILQPQLASARRIYKFYDCLVSLAMFCMIVGSVAIGIAVGIAAGSVTLGVFIALAFLTITARFGFSFDNFLSDFRSRHQIPE